MKPNIKEEIEQHYTKQSTANLGAHSYHLKIKANPSHTAQIQKSAQLNIWVR